MASFLVESRGRSLWLRLIRHINSISFGVKKKEYSDAEKHTSPVPAASGIFLPAKHLLYHSFNRRSASLRSVGDKTLCAAFHRPLCYRAYSAHPAGVPRFVSSGSPAKAWWVGHICHCHSDPIWTQRPLSPHHGSTLSGVCARYAYWGVIRVVADVLYAQASVARKASYRTRVVAGFCRGDNPC